MLQEAFAGLKCCRWIDDEKREEKMLEKLYSGGVAWKLFLIRG